MGTLIKNCYGYVNGDKLVGSIYVQKNNKFYFLHNNANRDGEISSDRPKTKLKYSWAFNAAITRFSADVILGPKTIIALQKHTTLDLSKIAKKSKKSIKPTITVVKSLNKIFYKRKGETLVSYNRLPHNDCGSIQIHNYFISNSITIKELEECKNLFAKEIKHHTCHTTCNKKLPNKIKFLSEFGFELVSSFTNFNYNPGNTRGIYVRHSAVHPQLPSKKDLILQTLKDYSIPWKTLGIKIEDVSESISEHLKTHI